jgi:hypothetical protein
MVEKNQLGKEPKDQNYHKNINEDCKIIAIISHGETDGRAS